MKEKDTSLNSYLSIILAIKTQPQVKNMQDSSQQCNKHEGKVQLTLTPYISFSLSVKSKNH